MTTVSREDGSPLTLIESPAYSGTLAADVGGPILLHVENRGLDDPLGASYNIELRRTLPPQAENLPQIAPDALENNWDIAHATPIGVGVLYDMNFVCPVPNGCPGGDHDYLRLPVKADAQYLLATFDLGPGVDTVLDLFWGSEDVPVATNDDARPNRSLLSVLRWRAPSDGEVIIRVAPRAGGLTPLVFDEKASSYRFAVALQDSDLARQLEERLAAQTNTPTATPTDVAAPPGTPVAAIPSGPPVTSPVASTAQPAETIRTGQAVVSTTMVLRAEPNDHGQSLQTLAQGTIVQLTGEARGMWVRVETTDGVLPGWANSADLRRRAEGDTGSSTVPSVPVSSTASPQPQTSTLVTPTISVTRLPPLPPPNTPPAVRATLTVTVTIVSAVLSTVRNPAPTPSADAGLNGVRVLLINTFGDVLAEAMTANDGRVVFTRDVPPDLAVAVLLPSVGLQMPVERTVPTLTIAIPKGAS